MTCKLVTWVIGRRSARYIVSFCPSHVLEMIRDYLQDVCWSLYFGGYSCVPLPAVQFIPTPFIDSQSDLESDDPPFLAKTFSEACSLFLIARRIIDVTSALTIACGALVDLFLEM